MRYLVYVLLAGKSTALRVHATPAAALADCQKRTNPGQLPTDAAASVAALAHGRAVAFTDRMGNPLVVWAADTSRQPADNSPRTVQLYVEDTLAAFGLVGWRMGWDNAKRRCGCCDYKGRQVRLSRHYVRMNTPADVRRTTLHEVAHALVGPGHGHKLTWRCMAMALGIPADRCNGRATMPKGQWTATCGCQGVVHTMHRRPKRLEGWRCRRCRQGITWTGPGTRPAAAAG